MKRYFLKIQYKGTNYHGWQIQPNAVTVQEKVNNALSTYLRVSIETVGCGRTDTGVHASEFYLHFDVAFEIIDIAKSLRSISYLLPYDIAAVDLFQVRPDFHARFDAISRTYQYHIHFQKDPFINDYSCKINYTLNIDKMNEAAKHLLEITDFSCFAKSHAQTLTNNCKVTFAKFICLDSNRIMFEITADRFLRNMVRAIVGTLMLVGEGKIQIEDFKKIIVSQDRKNAGASIDAKGLFLTNIVYNFD